MSKQAGDKIILIIDSVHEILIEKLTANGFICDYKPNIKPDEIKSTNKDYTGLILRSKIKINEEVIDSFPNLQFIGRVGAGMENINTQYANKKNIICLNSPEGNRDAVGEHAIGMLLSLFNNIHKANQEIKQGLWQREKNRGVELNTKTIGIIGYGNTGGAFAKKLKGFDVNVISYDKYKKNYSDNFTTEVKLSELLDKSDIISFHVPLTTETKYYFCDELLDNITNPVYLINTSRGEVVRTSTLVKGIKSGKILGACLDVHEFEHYSFENFFQQKLPAEFTYLLNAENVLLSPHIAGWTKESRYKLSIILAEKIIDEFKSY